MSQVIHDSLKFNRIIEHIYVQYTTLYPLNITINNRDIHSWRSNNVFSIIDFARLIQLLLRAKRLDDFIKESGADFDNLAMLVKVAVENGLVSLSKTGIIRDQGMFREIQVLSKKSMQFVPDYTYNQFPCDESSRFKRANFIISRYPFIEHLRFAIVGEDDFLSPLFHGLSEFHPIILEKDESIVKKLVQSNKNATVYALDITDDKEFHRLSIPPVKMFITDPPYTLHGALAFIYRGLSLLSKDSDIKEFYVILNPTMMGTHFATISNILSQSGVCLYEVLDNFSQYKLPVNFKERIRANAFLKRIGVESGAITYSSSSSLYVFRTREPNLCRIKGLIEYEKIYSHFI